MGEAPDDIDDLGHPIDRATADTTDDQVDDTTDDRAVPFDAGPDDPATVVANARRRHGIAGGFLAAGMLGVDQAINGRKPKQEAPIVVAANSDPVDIDRDGISVPLDDDGRFAVAAPPLPRRAPVTSPGSPRSRRRAR